MHQFLHFGFLTVLLFLPSVALAQCERRGRIVTEKGEPIPFATVSSLSRSVGTYADETGRFVYNGPCSDSVLISAVGFNQVRMLTSQLDLLVKLTSITLPTVTISAGKKKEEQYGYYHQVRFPPTYDFIPNTTCQLATFVANPEQREGQIVRLSYRFASIKSDLVNQFRVRVRLYRVKPGNVSTPGQDLLNESILADVNPTDKSLRYVLQTPVSFPPEGVWVGLEILGYEDKSGQFYLINRGEFGVRMHKKDRQHFLSPSIAMKNKVRITGKVSRNGRSWHEDIGVRDNTPMFGLTAAF